MFKARVKDARVIIHKTNLNAIVHYVYLMENHYIVSLMEILENALGNADLPYPNGTLHTLEDAIGTFIAWPKDCIELYTDLFCLVATIMHVSKCRHVLTCFL